MIWAPVLWGSNPAHLFVKLALGLDWSADPSAEQDLERRADAILLE
jgi:hypothetical protein